MKKGNLLTVLFIAIVLVFSIKFTPIVSTIAAATGGNATGGNAPTQSTDSSDSNDNDDSDDSDDSDSKTDNTTSTVAESVVTVDTNGTLIETAATKTVVVAGQEVVIASTEAAMVQAPKTVLSTVYSKFGSNADIKFSVGAVTSGEKLNVATSALSNESSKFALFDINLNVNGTAYHENLDGTVNVTLDLPTNFDASKVSVYYIDDNGNKTKCLSVVANNSVTFVTSHFSSYAIVEENLVASSSDNQATVAAGTEVKENVSPKTGDNNRMIIFAVVAFASIIVAVGTISFKKAK